MAPKSIASLALWLLLPALSCAFGAFFEASSFPGARKHSVGRPSTLMAKTSTMMSSVVGTVDAERSRNIACAPSSEASSSLASDYAVRILPSIDDSGGERGELRWELHPLSRWERPGQGEGTLALRALADCAELDFEDNDAACTLRCSWAQSDMAPGSDADTSWSVTVSADEGGDILPRELRCVLGRVMVQSAASRIANICTGREALLHVSLPLLDGEGCQKLSLSDLFPVDGDNDNASTKLDGVRRLFDSLDPEYAKTEIVDMVDQEGRVLGSLPRPYVHSQNILHRGIGMIISKDEDVFESFKSGKTPEVYVHRRTSTKRIFPDLYDMFVGGVSCSGESARLTAAREVAEELGLKRALDLLGNDGAEGKSPLSEELFRCTVCTSYNRCVVSMFAYTCDTSSEDISWQEEEVAWGDYVPYDVVEAAGDAFIERLREGGAWPGTLDDEGERGEETDAEAATKGPRSGYGDDRSWESWDFVPDGLLVWEAWKDFVRREI